MAAREVREIKIEIKSDGGASLKAMAAGFGKVNRSIQQTNATLGGFQSAFNSLKGLAAGFIGVNLIKQVVLFSDSMQKLTDRLTLSEGSSAAARDTLGALGDVAARTKTGIEDIATVYSRLSLSLKDTGINSAALVQLTETLQNTFRISGATTAEATAATIQLSQGLASGQVRGQELRSVLEQNALAGEILAKKLGIARGQLLKFAEKNGGISADTVLSAFADAMTDVSNRAEKLQPTIGEALTTAFNKLKIELGDLNKEFGLTSKAVAVIELAGANLGKLTIALGVAVTAWKVYNSWVLISTKSTAAFFALLSTGLVGFLVKAAIGLVAFAASAGGVVVAVIAATTALIALVALSPSVRNFLSDIASYALSFTKSSLAAESFTDAHRKAKAAMDGVNGSQQNFVLQTPDVVKQFYSIEASSANGYGSVLKFDNALQDFADQRKREAGSNLTYAQSLAQINQQFLTDKNAAKYNAELKKIEIKELTSKFNAGKIKLEEYNKKLNEINFGKGISSLKEYRGELSELNKEFALEVSLGYVRNYSSALEGVRLEKLARDLNEGRISLLSFRKEVRSVQLSELNREVAEGSIKLNQFRDSTQRIELAQLNEDFRSGTLDVYAYNKAITETQDKFMPGSALFTGINDYIQSAGTLSQGVASAITGTFSKVEETFVAFTKNGKFAFKDMAVAILDDLNRIIVRSLIIRPLAQGLLNGISAGAGASNAGATDAAGSYSNYAAKGAAFDGSRANFFATGGVVTKATGFTYGGGKSGVMGEAGPEAILPLKRNSSGDLGVQSAAPTPVIVNITNNGNSEVQQSEREGPNGERILDVMITQKVKEAFAKGYMDKQMSQNYGLRRKGI